MKPRYLDVTPAAEYLGLTVWSVRSLVKRREIPYIKVGRRIRFDVQDLDLWMRRQRVEATS